MHNLRQANARIPLARLSVVTGVSGSGKSTLARDVLLDNLSRRVGKRLTGPWQGCRTIRGWEAVDRVLEVDQTPIGKTPRSCPATYVGFWDDIRKLYAGTRESRLRGWTGSRFSFNTGDGRCPECEGQGMRTIEMSFLPDVKVPCNACHGARFNQETLGVRWNGRSAGDVLRMEVDDAIGHFSAHRRIARALQLMQDVGLGYLTLGQPSPTLSGGEAQRIKLVTELTKAHLDEGVLRTGRASRAPHTLYVLDEPTVGLSTADVEKLIRVLHRLVDAGHTVVVIEHNLDIIAEADWIVDLGPEGGDQGGRVVAQGSPEQLCASATHTGRILAEFMKCTCVFEDRLTGRSLQLLDPVARIAVHRRDELPAAWAALEAARRAGHWVALLLDYELGEWLEPGIAAAPDGSAPDPQPRLTALIHARAEQQPCPAREAAATAGHTGAAPTWPTPRPHPGVSRARHAQAIEAIRTGIARGDYYQINYTLPLHLDWPQDLDPARAYAYLAARHPVAHAACVRDGDRWVLSLSPELFVAREGTRLRVRPMKGTAPRHADPAWDRQAGEALRRSAKNRAENLMIVDLLRNDLGRIAVPGSVRVPALFRPGSLSFGLDR